MDAIELLIDLHLRNDRQGPGDDAETRRALELTRLDPDAPLRVADIGCGTGASALVLARHRNAHVTAVDAAAPFIERLRERSREAGLEDRMTPMVASMESLPFEDGRFDLLWSEGAIYNMGFAPGIRAWRRFLRPGGVLAVTELSWTTQSRPADVEAHWTREYPAITTPAENLRTLEREGYTPLAFFFLTEHCWDENYYVPLRASFAGFLLRHAGNPVAREIVASEEAEITLRRERGAWYGYGFYIARRTGGGPER